MFTYVFNSFQVHSDFLLFFILIFQFHIFLLNKNGEDVIFEWCESIAPILLCFCKEF